MIPFHFACLKGHINIAEFLIKNHNELNIDLNTRDKFGQTAFYMACGKDQLKISEILMQNVAELEIDLNAIWTTAILGMSCRLSW